MNKIKSFLQSSAWEEFQNNLGKTTSRIKDKLLIRNHLLLNQSYLYAPRVNFKNEKDFEDFLDSLKALAKKQKTFFARFEPDADNKINFDDYDLKKVSSRQPKQTLILRLDKTEEELLSTMKSKTRYNIRLAKRKGVKISQSTDKKDLDNFIKIAKITAKRDKIKFHEKEYYHKMLEVLKKHNMIKIYSASYKNKTISSMIILDFKNTRYYLHGASSNLHRNVMSPYLLQWQAILDAKKSGKIYYDFWGVAPLKIYDSKFMIQNSDHAWKGITRFKLGFAPTQKTGIYREYPGCFEIGYGKKRYFFYSMFKKVM